ncbi:MAG: group II intron reverse transcriptase domain-containing protein [Verrucomicrobia bacterium]|nr:group II intron reverse transcriptase domain-containing protein [Verrucomicrobiota bacterium]
MKIFHNFFDQMVSLDHLFQSWNYFRRGKGKRKDVQQFERHLEDNIFELQLDLQTLQYQHGPYHQFFVFDPKERHISGASVRDQLVHQAIYTILTDLFDRKFIFHSLSSRLQKGTHIGIDHLHRMIRKVSANGKKPCFALKMDIRRFFDNIDHQILKKLIQKNLHDEKILHLVGTIIDSFNTQNSSHSAVGIPLGNVTSQLFANIYLHELDMFIKQTLHERYYLRYCDDFIFLSPNEHHLKSLIPIVEKFLLEKLRLELHPKKIILRKLNQGIDFVGYVLFSKYRLVRATTKRRIKKRLKETYEQYLEGKIDANFMDQRLQSYLGILSHANQHTLSQALKNAYWVRSERVI